jgi:hypothetical protein
VERPRKFLHQNFHECLISAYLFSAESSLLVFDAPEATLLSLITERAPQKKPSWMHPACCLALFHGKKRERRALCGFGNCL